jgi:hypothetical protein
MSHPIEESYRRLEQRAAGLESLVDEDTNKQITSALQKAYGSFKACAELLLVLEDESHSSVEKALGRAKSSPTFSGKVKADVTGEICTRWNERESTWRKSGSCPTRGTNQNKL